MNRCEYHDQHTLCNLQLRGFSTMIDHPLKEVILWFELKLDST